MALPKRPTNAPSARPARTKQSALQAAPSTISYKDASALDRPQAIPAAFKVFCIILLVAAGIIAWRVVGLVFDGTVYAQQHAQEEVKQITSREVNPNYPVLTVLMPCSDATILTYLQDMGNKLFDLTAASGSTEDVFDWVKIPDGADGATVTRTYVNGISKASSRDAAEALYGGWRLTVERDNMVSMRLRYVDFSAVDPDKAIQNAIMAQQLAGSTMGETGIDDAGNTYATGTVTTDTGAYSWKISTCQLKEVYDVIGLPDNAFYVSVRVTG